MTHADSYGCITTGAAYLKELLWLLELQGVLRGLRLSVIG